MEREFAAAINGARLGGFIAACANAVMVEFRRVHPETLAELLARSDGTPMLEVLVKGEDIWLFSKVRALRADGTIADETSALAGVFRGWASGLIEGITEETKQQELAAMLPAIAAMLRSGYSFALRDILSERPVIEMISELGTLPSEALRSAA